MLYYYFCILFNQSIFFWRILQIRPSPYKSSNEKPLGTLTEFLVPAAHSSNIQSNVQTLLSWTYHNFMKLNYTKTKEMILRPFSNHNIF